MVKSPGPKHSRPRKEPVTIELSPEDVERKESPRDRSSTGPDKPGPAAEKEAAGASTATTGPAAGDAGKREGAAKEDRRGAQPSASSTGTGPQADGTGKAGASSQAGSGGTGPKGPAKTAESGTGPGGPAAPPGARAAAPAPGGRGGGSLIAGVAGGLVVLLLIAGLQWAGLWPGASTARDSAAIAELRQDLADIRQALAAEEPGLTSDEVDARIAAAAEIGVSSLRQEMDELAQNVAQQDGAPVDLQPLQSRLDELEAALAALDSTTAPEAAIAEVGDRMAEIESRLEALEGELATVSSEMEDRADEPRAALVIAASALKAAIDRGDPFQTELETYAALAPETEGIAELGTYASSGVATRSAILSDVPEAADRMAATARETVDAEGFWDGLWQSARNLVTVRPVGMVEGDGTEAIVARLEAAIGDGDLDRAIAEYEQLPPAAQTAGADFMDMVRARHRADTLVEQALAQALRAS